MKKLWIFFALFLFGVTGYAQSARTVYVAKDGTYYNIPTSAADTINASETFYVIVQNFQNYPSMQDVWIDLTDVSGAPSVTVTVYGKKFSGDTYVSLGTPAVWTATDFVYGINASNKYRYYKIELVASGATQQTLINKLEFKGYFTDAESSTNLHLSGTLEVDGESTFNDHINLTAGADILGSTTSDINFGSDNFTLAGASGDMTTKGTVDITGALGLTASATLGAGADLIGSATSDITIGTTAFTVAGATGNVGVGGDLAVDGTSNLDDTDIDGTFTMDGTAFDVNSTSTVAIDNTNTTNGVTINTVTSTGPVSIGHTTSETTVNDNLTVTGLFTSTGGLQINDVVVQDITNAANTYDFPIYTNWTTSIDIAGGGSLGAYFRANVGHTVQNVIAGAGKIKFLTLAADESINYGAGWEVTLELDDVDTHTITVTDHLSALNLYFDGSSKVEGVGGGLYSKMNLSRAMWNSTENFGIETNGYQVETAPNSHLDYGFNVYNDGTMTAGLWIHNNPAHGTLVSDIKLQNGALIDNGSADLLTITEVTVDIDGALTASSVASDGVLSGTSVSLTANVIQYTELVTLTATEIVGTDPGDIGHADGAILVAAPASGTVLQFVSAMLIYDYASAAYTGGGNDLVINIGSTGAQLAVVKTMASSFLLGAAGDKMYTPYVEYSGQVGLPVSAGGALSLKSTAWTQPSTAAGVLRCYVTYNVITTGL